MSTKLILSRMRRSIFFMTGLVLFIIVMAFVYVLPPFLKYDPVATSLTERFIAPEWFANGFNSHVFGTDYLGRDVLARLVIGGHYSFSLGFTVVILVTTVGCVLGTVSGYFGGWADMIIMRFCEAMMAIPTMIMAIAMIAVLGQSTRNLIIIMVIGGWVQLCKLTRNNVRIVKSQEFVLASKALGAKGPHIMFRQIFPNVTTQIIVLTSQRVAGVIMMEAGLSYLGLGIPLPAPTWGNMISEGRVYLMSQSWLVFIPGIALMMTVLAFNFLGDGLRDVLDTRRKA